MTDNFTGVFIGFINALKIPVSRQTVIDELQKHPDYGSMYAYSQLLDDWNVPNAAIKLPFERLEEIGKPFIAYTAIKKFALVKFFRPDKVILSLGGRSDKELTHKQFRDIYTGTVLLGERKENSGELAYNLKMRSEIV